MSSLKLTNVRLRIDIHASQDVHFLIDTLSWQKNWETWSLGFSGADSERLRCCSSDPGRPDCMVTPVMKSESISRLHPLSTSLGGARQGFG